MNTHTETQRTLSHRIVFEIQNRTLALVVAVLNTCIYTTNVEEAQNNMVGVMDTHSDSILSHFLALSCVHSILN